MNLDFSILNWGLIHDYVLKGLYFSVTLTVVATLGESAAYTPTTRPAFVPGAIASGAVDNTAARAEFTFTEAKRIYGAFMASSPTRGGSTGVLISAARFASAKDVTAGDTLRVTAAVELVSAAE